MSTIAEPTIEYATPQTPVVEHRRALRVTVRIAVVLLLLGVAAWATRYGLQLRRQQWGETSAIHYMGDVSNGFGWGHLAQQHGLMRIYDLYSSNQLRSVPNALDYTPLRLTIVNLWARWATTHFGPSTMWQNDYELTRPMLQLNAVAELMSSILIFMLVRMWIVRQDDARRREEMILTPPPPFRGVVRGMIGGLFFWFNPAVIWDGHCFPQWDVWNTPFFLGAALLASIDGWFAAGCCVVIGAFLKGQILLVAPIFLIWPLVQLRFDAIVRFTAGFVFGGAMLAVYWLNASPRAITWYMLMCAAVATSWPFVMRRPLTWWMGLLPAAAMLLAWPWKSDATIYLKLVSLGIIGSIYLLRFAPRRILPQVYALAAGVIMLMLIPMFNASERWFTQGFEYGTQKLMWMATRGTYSLPQFLVTTYGWSNNDPNVVVTLPFAIPLIGDSVEFRRLMLWIYGICLLLCGIGAGIHSRRNDTRFLAALVAPWLCWFVLLTQLNNRYMIWAAGLSGLLVGVSWGMTILGAVVSFIGWTAIAHILHWSNDSWWPGTKRLLDTINPQMIWPLMLLAAIYLYIAVVPRRRTAPTLAE